MACNLLGCRLWPPRTRALIVADRCPLFVHAGSSLGGGLMGFGPPPPAASAATTSVCTDREMGAGWEGDARRRGLRRSLGSCASLRALLSPALVPQWHALSVVCCVQVLHASYLLQCQRNTQDRRVHMVHEMPAGHAAHARMHLRTLAHSRSPPSLTLAYEDD